MLQTINLGYNLSLSIRLFALPQDDALILASAMDDSSIQIFTERTLDDDKVDLLTNSATLKGHEDWVRGLDFTLDNGESKKNVGFPSIPKERNYCYCYYALHLARYPWNKCR